MDAWPAPEIPRLPGRGLLPRVYDTAMGAVRPIGEGDVARLYVCGITPYDATHLGHAATYVAFDLLNRVWRDAGREVLYVQNVTDVDDPLLERAAQTGADWDALAKRETALYREDMTELRVLPPAHYLGVVEALPLVVGLIETLRSKGAAYEVDADIYFAVHTDPRFGAVTGLAAADMLRLFGERGGDPDRPGKKDPLDCLLWQAARPGEPAWDSPFGPGRPGWHIECVAIALEYLGMSFDVQGGGSDLAFPHHEMGASEAQVVTGTWPYAQAYVHAGMVGLDGEKMLAHHYRQDWEWAQVDLDAATERLARWRAAVSRPDGPAADRLLAEVRAALSDDLDAPAALAAMDRWADRQNTHGGPDEGATGVAARAVDALLGVAL